MHQSRTRLFAGLSDELEIIPCLPENRGVPGSSPGLATPKAALQRGFLVSGAEIGIRDSGDGTGIGRCHCQFGGRGSRPLRA
jgi:hypothetical protein